MSEVLNSIDKKFKEFSHLIKSCTAGCGGTGYIFDYKKEDGLLKSNSAKQCVCLKKVYCYALYKDANIPSEYYNLSFETDFLKRANDENEQIKADIKSVVDNIKEFHENGLGLYLYGGPGCGKSMAGIEVVKKALRKGLTGYYEWFPLIIDAFMKKGWTADPKKDFYNNIFETKDVLVIDELGKETQDKFSFKKEDIARILEINILKKRSNKTTILISNIEKGVESLKDTYSVFVESVVRQKFKPIGFLGKDFRPTNKSIDQFFKSKEKESKGE